MARATHYLADLGHPFHTKAIPYQLLYKAFGKIKNLFQELAAMHNGHEVYAQYRFRTEFLPYKQNLIQGSIQGYNEHTDLIKNLNPYRDQSSRQLSPIYYILLKNFGSEFIQAYTIDLKSPLDSSKQTLLGKKAAQKILFRNPHNPALPILDAITSHLLFNVGKMLGLFFATIKTDFGL